MERYTETHGVLVTVAIRETNSESYSMCCAQGHHSSLRRAACPPAPSFRSNEHRTRNTTLVRRINPPQTINHAPPKKKNSLALNLRCSSFRFDRPPALGRHALDLIVAAFVVEAFGYADVVASTAIRGKANALPFGACRSG